MLESITTAGWLPFPVRDHIILACEKKPVAVVNILGEQPPNPLHFRFERDAKVTAEADAPVKEDGHGNLILPTSALDTIAKHDGERLRVSAFNIQMQPRFAEWDLTGFKAQMEKFRAECHR